jgi:hypothetical protein
MRLLILITITIFLSIGNITNAQSIVFNKVYDYSNTYDGGFEIIETTDNGYLLVGSYATLSTGGGLIIKLNNLGDTLWTKQYDLTIGGDDVYSVVELVNGGYAICGLYSDTATMTGDAYIMRLDSQGDSLWMNRYGSIFNDTPYSIVQSLDGEFICAGWTFNTIDPNYADAWVFKTDSLGNLLWEKQFDNYGLQDNFDKVIITPDGNIVCAGVTVIDAVTGLDYVVKLNQQGDTIWTKELGGIGCGETFDINTTLDGGFIGCGARCVNGFQRASVYKLDSLGNMLWYNTYARSSGASDYFSFSAVHELPNGNFMAAGSDFDYTQPVPASSTRIRMMEFNANGDSIWSKQYPHSTGGDEDYMFDMKLTSDGGFIICGYVIHTSPTKNDALVIKIDSNRCDNVTCQLTIGVEEEKKFDVDFLIYPNPTTGIIHIELKEKTTSDLTITIYNLFGEKVYNTKVIQNDININRLDNGLYFIQLTDKNNKQLFTQKLLLQK